MEQGSGWARRQSAVLTALGRDWKVPCLPCGCSITVRSCPSITQQLGSGGGGSLKAASGDGIVDKGMWHILWLSGQMSIATVGQ